jgi:hypothetical protein
MKSCPNALRTIENMKTRPDALETVKNVLGSAEHENET